MASRSECINRLMFQRTSTGETSSCIRIPRGYNIFEMVVKFCYGMKVELTAPNIAPLYCAANLLEMSDDLEQGHLISKTETFLSFIIFTSWKDTIQILKSCEAISSWARELGIVKRCSESIAWKASIGSHVITCGDNEMQYFDFLGKGYNSNCENLPDSWWFKDLLLLRIDHFIEVIASCKRKVLPEDEKSVSCNFVLHLFKLGLIVKVDFELLNKLERRIASMLVSCRAKDLLVKNYGYRTTIYDVGIVVRVVQANVSYYSGKFSSRMHVIRRLVNEYLTLVARDDNLPANIFQSLVEALPKSSRLYDDYLYRTIDMYLKAHPSLTEEERSEICRAMEYEKLSQEARNHALRNDRLPLNTTTRFILLEQVNMIRSTTAAESNYQRTKSQMIMRVEKSLGDRWMNCQKEIKMMKQDVEIMKAQLCQLQTFRMILRRAVKRCSKV